MRKLALAGAALVLLAPLAYAAMFDRLGLSFALWLSFTAGVLTLIGMTTLFAMRRG